MSNYYEEDYDESECILCGDDANGYLFCKSCYRKYKNQSILVKIDNCEEFEIIEEDYDEDIPEWIDEGVQRSSCIICMDEANGYHFCPDCYNEYKNKTIKMQITNCYDYEILDKDYSGPRYITDDGHIVKSKSEREIDNYLFSHGIVHAYETPFPNENNPDLHPDFYLPNFGGKGKDVYIEHWGYDKDNYKYTKIKNYKIPIYKKAGITLICTYEKTDMINPKISLKYKLENYKEGKINFLEEI